MRDADVREHPVKSTEPPGGPGTMGRMGRDGQGSYGAGDARADGSTDEDSEYMQQRHGTLLRDGRGARTAPSRNAATLTLVID